MALNCNINNMQDRVNLALKIGWTIDDNAVLRPPKHFECSEYIVIGKSYSLEQGQVTIPHYFNDDYIMTTGNWNLHRVITGD